MSQTATSATAPSNEEKTEAQQKAEAFARVVRQMLLSGVAAEVTYNLETGEIKVAERQEPINELVKDLIKAQAEMTKAVMDRVNEEFGNSGYASLDAMLGAVRGPLTDNNLAVVQKVMPDLDRGRVVCRTILMHTSGQTMVTVTELPVDRANCHGYGSAATSAKKMSLSGAVGIAQGYADDDGNAAVGTASAGTAAAAAKVTDIGAGKKAEKAAAKGTRGPTADVALVPPGVYRRIAEAKDTTNMSTWLKTRFEGAALKALEADLAKRVAADAATENGAKKLDDPKLICNGMFAIIADMKDTVSANEWAAERFSGPALEAVTAAIERRGEPAAASA